MGCFCHRPDRNCEKCHLGGIFECKMSEAEDAELKARKKEGEHIHCGDCKSLVTNSNQTPVSCFGSYCKKYKKELDYYDGPIKLEICYEKKYGRTK